MPPQGRVSDLAQAPVDAHGCPMCPHPVLGPALQGSPDVLVNSLPAMRVGDPGMAVPCCDGNTWNAQMGSMTVLINNKGAHRMGDMTKHCGGIGKLIMGSLDVLVGG